MRKLTTLILLTLGMPASGQQAKVTPETVMVTFRAKAGAEDELARVIEKHWATGSALGLFQPTPHLTVRGQDGDKKTYFVDVFTWRDATIPDHAPPAIQAVWADMNRLTEARGGKPGLEFAEVSVVAGAPR